jgi:hypothetical protein
MYGRITGVTDMSHDVLLFVRVAAAEVLSHSGTLREWLIDTRRCTGTLHSEIRTVLLGVFCVSDVHASNTPPFTRPLSSKG